jgi:hypothetical protein
MKLWKKLSLGLGFLLTGKNAMAIGTTAVMAGATASQLGADPLPWIIGSAGAAVAFLLRRPAKWDYALAHGAISVFCGGVGAPWAATVVAHYVHPVLANDLVLAFGLSIGWPVFVPWVMAWLARIFGALPAAKNGGQ